MYGTGTALTVTGIYYPSHGGLCLDSDSMLMLTSNKCSHAHRCSCGATVSNVLNLVQLNVAEVSKRY